MADPLQPEPDSRPARSRRFQYGIAAVLVLQVVAAVWLGIWRGFGVAGVFCAGIIGGVLAVSVVSTVSRILSVEHRGRPEAAGDAATRLMAVAAILIGVGLLSMMVFAFARG